MTLLEFKKLLREMIGNPNTGQTSDRQLMSYIEDALDWLANHLKYALKEDTVSLALQATRQEYPLNPDVSQIMWVRYNGVKLSPATTYLWDRDGHNWKEASGTPDEFAFEGQALILNRKPTAAVVTAASRMQIKYVSSSPGIRPSNIPKLARADCRLAVKYAAIRWCMTNPNADNDKRRAGYESLLAMDLAEAKKRHGQNIEDNQPSIALGSSRQGAAR